MVHEIVDMAVKENDHATRNFIDWKVDEQVEEVASANELAQMVRYAETPGQLMMLEGRVYHMLES
jgi:ferritin